MPTRNKDHVFNEMVDGLYYKALKALRNGDVSVSNYKKANVIHKYLQSMHYGILSDVAYYVILHKTKECNKLSLLLKVLYNTILRTPLLHILTINRFNKINTVINERKVRIIVKNILNIL